MRISESKMYDRFIAGDPAWDGRFFTGVLTTGIYCLPSCKARKPKRENVRFFATCEAARGAGLRACKKCHPDDFARGADPLLETIETLVAEIRTNPGNFPRRASDRAAIWFRVNARVRAFSAALSQYACRPVASRSHRPGQASAADDRVVPVRHRVPDGFRIALHVSRKLPAT